MPESPYPARLRQSFTVAPFGGSIHKLADLDGDGQFELLILQSAGQLRCPFYTAANLGVDARDQALHCLTAVKLDGTILWQDGTAWDEPGIPFSSHGGSGMLAIDDIDGDGRAEVLVIRGDQLTIREGASGRLRAQTALPADNFSTIYTAQFGPPENGRQILVKVNDRAYAPWQYANPTVVYNADLTLYHEPFAVRGAGHNMVAADIDGDGRDELLIGYSLLDHDLNVRWSIDFGADFDYVKEHADEVVLTDVDGDGALEIRYAGSQDFVVADLAGRVLWTTPAGHSQNSIQGPWGPDGEQRIIMNEKNRGLHGLASDGAMLWSRTDINGYARHNVHWSRQQQPTHWPLFQPERKPVQDLPYRSDPTWSRDLWPRFIDHAGRLHDVFPWDESYAIPPGRIRAARSYDAGLAYPSIVADLDGSGLDDVVIIGRQTVWVFSSPEKGV